MNPTKLNDRLVLHTVHMSIPTDPTETHVLVNKLVPVDHTYCGGGDGGGGGGEGRDDGGCAAKAMAATMAVAAAADCSWLMANG